MWKTAALLQQFASAAPSTAKCVDAACTKPGHDPSAMQRVGKYHVVLTTGSGGGEAMGLKYMNDSAGWRQGEDSYFVPPWLETMEPWKGCAATACPFWAPDLVSNGNGVAPGGEDFVLYYSVPSTTHPACIGRAVGRFVASPVPRVDWRDALGGPVLCGNEDASSGPHVIDPSVSVIDGIPWLSFGSWSSDGSAGGGVWVVPLDETTGALADDVLRDCGGRFPRCWGTSDRFVNVANNRQPGDQYADTNAIEASYLYDRPGSNFTYLFVDYYWCCRGLDSTYELRVGRSTAGAAGPFFDDAGADMADGGGRLVLGSGDGLVGPGHAGILEDGDVRVFTFDYQGVAADPTHEYKTQARHLAWSDDGWPVVSDVNFVVGKSDGAA